MDWRLPISSHIAERNKFGWSGLMAGAIQVPEAVARGVARDRMRLEALGRSSSMRGGYRVRQIPTQLSWQPAEFPLIVVIQLGASWKSGNCYI